MCPEDDAGDVTADPLAVTLLGGESREAPLAPGTWIGRYLVTGVLGHGGMGVVYAAHDPDLDRPVAIKLLRPELRSARARLLREGQAVARLRHPAVVTVHDVGEHGDDLFIAMELVRGGTLGAWMRDAPRRRRPWRDVLARMLPAGRGIAAAHAADLVHRDFKPENVLLGEDGRVVVTDFGLAQLGDDPTLPPSSQQDGPVELTRTGAMLGTPAYMSPEQFRGERSDARSDQFSYCVTLYEALTGARPFDPRDGSVPSVSDLQVAVERGRIAPIPPRVAPRWLRRAIGRGLEPDPSRRFASMDALLAALVPPRRRRLVLAAAGIAVAAAAVAALLLTGRDKKVAAVDTASCDSTAAAIDASWSDAVRARYRDRAAGWPGTAGEDAWLDDYARRWSTMRWTVCAAPRAGARAVTCLDDARAAFARAVDRPLDFWPALPALADCLAPAPNAIALPTMIVLGPQGIAQLSPDGRTVAASSYGDVPVLIDVDATSFAPRPVPGARLVSDWLADGRQLLQRADRSQVLRAPDGTDTPIAPIGDLLRTQINVLAPDGTRIAVQEADGIAVLSLVDGTRLAAVRGPAHEVAWEPDGRRLAVVSLDLSTLTLLDTRSDTTVARPIHLHSRGLGEIGLAWSAPGHLWMSGAYDTAPDYGLFELELDDASQITRAPALRWTAPNRLLLRLYDVAAGRALVEQQGSRQRMFRWHDGQREQLPPHFNELKLGALDTRTGLAVAGGDRTIVTLDVATRARTVRAAPAFALPSFRAGAVAIVTPRAAGAYTIETLDTDGKTTAQVSFEWPLAHGAPLLRCSAADTRRCVIAGKDEATLYVSALDDRGLVGEPVRIDDINGSIDVRADGHVLAPVDGRVLEVDLGSGRTSVFATLSEPDCWIRHARWSPDGKRAWLGLLCPDRFAIGSIGRDEPFAQIVAADGWISGIEPLPDGDVVYSMMDWDPQLVVLDGLARRLQKPSP